jgi:kumamolisin
MRRCIGLLTIAAALIFLGSAAFSSSAQAQESRIVIPDSSIERPGLAHTNIILNIHQDNTSPCGSTCETPASLACVYELVAQVTGCPIATTSTNPSGGARAIALVDAYDNPDALTDLTTFSNQFGLPIPTFSQVYAQGSKPQNNPGGWSLEEALDIEMAHAMAPNAEIILVEAAQPTNADLYAAENFAANLVVAAGGGEISNSWSGGETRSETGNDSKYFNTAGIVYFASTGDTAFSLGYPAVSPNVVAAGGTSIKRSGGSFTSEQYWDNQYGGGGGGLSRYEKIPSYQNVIKTIVGTKRGVPDISFDADPVTGPAMYDADGGYGWIQIGGTSVSSPALAGIINAAGSFATSSNVELTELYNDYGSSNYSSEFRDITLGNSKCKVGWDVCTGIGSILTYTGK